MRPALRLEQPCRWPTAAEPRRGFGQSLQTSDIRSRPSTPRPPAMGRSRDRGSPTVRRRRAKGRPARASVGRRRRTAVAGRPSRPDGRRLTARASRRSTSWHAFVPSTQTGSAARAPATMAEPIDTAGQTVELRPSARGSDHTRGPTPVRSSRASRDRRGSSGCRSRDQHHRDRSARRTTVAASRPSGSPGAGTRRDRRPYGSARRARERCSRLVGSPAAAADGADLRSAVQPGSPPRLPTSPAEHGDRHRPPAP